MMNIIRNFCYWVLDYLYVIHEQVLSIVTKSQPEQYRNKAGRPIILIPGVYENWRFMRPIAKTLYRNGYDVHTLEGLGYNRGTVESMANLVKDYVTTRHLTNAIVIAHSKGGLIGKLLLSMNDSPDVITGMITLNTPFSGSKYAYILPFKSLRIFTPHSKLLTLLAKDKKMNKRIVSIYGIFDPHIPGGSFLEGATNIQLQTYGHFRIMNDVKVHDAILENLSRFQD